MRKTVKKVSLIAFLLFFVATTFGQKTNTSTNLTLKKAQAQIDSLNYQKAIDLSESIITQSEQLDTQLVKAYSVKGDAFRGWGQYDDAIVQYQQAKKVAEQLEGAMSIFVAQAYNDLGLCYYRKGELSIAETNFAKALTIRLQLLGEEHVKIADSYNNLGNIAFDRKDLTTARDYYEQSLAIRSQSLPADHLDIASSYNNLGSCYRLAGQYQRAIDYYMQSIDIRKAKLGLVHPKVAQSCTNLGLSYEQMNEVDKAMDYYQQSLQIYAQNDMENHPNIALSYAGLGRCYAKLGNQQQALDYFTKALAIQKEKFGEESVNLIPVYNNLANSYKYIGDYAQAMLFYENNIYILEKTFGNQHPFAAATYNNIGLIQVELTNFDKALDYYRQALAIYEQQQNYHRVANTWNNIATCLRQQKRFTEAVQAYQRSGYIFEQLYGAQSVDNAKVYYNIGNCLVEDNQLEEALDYFKKAEWSGYDKGKLAARVGVVFQKQGKLDEALAKFEDAFQLLGISTPQAPNINSSTPFIEIIGLLNDKAKALNDKYKAEKSNQWLTAILSTTDFSIGLIHSLRKQYQEENSKRKLSESAYKTFEIGIAALYELFQQTKDKKYLEKAFRYSEQSRSNLILEEQLSQKAALDYQIPDSLLVKEKQLKTSITYYEKQKYNTKDSIFINELNGLLFEQKQAYQQLIEELQATYPAYYQAKYEDVLISIDDLQKELLPEEAVIEYFVGDSSVYIFLITPNTVDLKSVVIDALEQEVKLLREGITRYYIDIDTQTEEGYRFLLIQYLRAAHFLYQKLIQPIADQLPHQLTIINSRVLHSLPFDALVTDLPDSTLHRLRDVAYLIKKHEINYANSATLLHTIRNRKNTFEQPTRKLLAFAPTFAFPNNLSLAPLNHNTKEVEQIQSLLPESDVLIGADASKTNFINRASNYQMLHLATHAKADALSGDYSFLAFANKTNIYQQEELLYAKDIYNLRLNANLVVLSACETGTGEFSRGEGVVSLAGAFLYSGAKGIVTTLWSINDATTKGLIANFYEELNKGIPVGIALRNAKLRYIEEADDPNPFFWAAFVLTGENAVINEDGNVFFSWFILFFFIGLLLSFLLWNFLIRK